MKRKTGAKSVSMTLKPLDVDVTGDHTSALLSLAIPLDAVCALTRGAIVFQCLIIMVSGGSIAGSIQLWCLDC